MKKVTVGLLFVLVLLLLVTPPVTAKPLADESSIIYVQGKVGVFWFTLADFSGSIRDGCFDLNIRYFNQDFHAKGYLTGTRLHGFSGSFEFFGTYSIEGKTITISWNYYGLQGWAKGIVK